MILNISYQKNLFKTIIFDIISITFVVFIPVVSHLSGFPFYVFEPMRILIIPYFLLTRSKNAYFLAIALPLISFLIVGHPVFFKFPLVAIDLFVNIIFLNTLINKQINKYICLLISILLSKLVYYLFKYIFINLDVLKGNLVDTNIVYQIANMFILIIVIFAFKKKDKKYQ